LENLPSITHDKENRKIPLLQTVFKFILAHFLALNAIGTYDFVVGVLNYAKRSEKNNQDITSYIEAHPECETSDIIEYMISRGNYYEHAQHIVGVESQMQIRA
jgi:hypothetical protein